VYKSTILLFAPPSALLTLLQYCCTTTVQGTPLPRTLFVHAIQHTILAKAILCKGQPVKELITLLTVLWAAYLVSLCFTLFWFLYVSTHPIKGLPTPTLCTSPHSRTHPVKELTTLLTVLWAAYFVSLCITSFRFLFSCAHPIKDLPTPTLSYFVPFTDAPCEGADHASDCALGGLVGLCIYRRFIIQRGHEHTRTGN